MTPAGYPDLWFAAAVLDRRVTAVPGLSGKRLGGFGLSEPGPPPSVAGLLPDGLIRAAGPAGDRLAHELAALADHWRDSGSPPMTAWTAQLALGGDAGRPIWVPATFTLAS